MYGGVLAMGHILLFITLYPTTSLILFVFFIPCAYIGAVLTLIHQVQKEAGFTDTAMFLSHHYDNMFLMPDMSLFVIDSPMDIDYDIGIH